MPPALPNDGGGTNSAGITKLKYQWQEDM